MSWDKFGKVGTAGVAGAAAGYGASQYFGMRTAGMAGPGSGFGSSAGVASGIFGALASMATFAVVDSIIDDALTKK